MSPNCASGRLALAGLVLATQLLSCAGPQRLSSVTGAPLADHPRIALLPLENLSGAADAGEAMTRLIGAEITSRGWCELVDIGQVQGIMRRLHVRNSAALSIDQLHALGDSLSVHLVLAGSVLEHKATNTDEGTIPAVAMTLKLLEASSGRVVWAKALAISGKDHETLFGYGRENDPVRLDARLVDEMLDDLGRLARTSPVTGREGKR